jgi:hypothetical protein
MVAKNGIIFVLLIFVYCFLKSNTYYVILKELMSQTVWYFFGFRYVGKNTYWNIKGTMIWES